MEGYSSIPTENQFEARSTLVLTMMDVSSFATLAKKMKHEIDNFDPDTKSFSYTFIGIVAFTLLLQVSPLVALNFILPVNGSAPYSSHSLFN